MVARTSDPAIPSIANPAANARTGAEPITPEQLDLLIPPIARPPPAAPPERVFLGARPGVLATPIGQLPAMTELTGIVRALAGERSVHPAIVRLQRDVRSLLRLSDALCVWIDWPRRRVWSVGGQTSAQVRDLVLEVAGGGHRAILGSALLEPLGPPPARWVFAFRRPPGTAFEPHELAMISTLAAGIAPLLDQLIAQHRAARGTDAP